MRWLNTQMIGTLAVLAATLVVSTTQALAKGGQPAEPRQSAQARDEKRADAQVTYGRAVVFRAGHLPQRASNEVSPDKTRPAQPIRPTHYLDTILPVIIQGAPSELALRRHRNTG